MTCFNRRGILPAGLKVEQIELIGNSITIRSHAPGVAAPCPRCGKESRQIHSRYQRRLADFPAHGRQVMLEVTVRRFRCRAVGCRTKIFAERVSPTIAQPHGRRTTRLQGLVRHLGLALGGRPAQTLAKRLLLPVSKDTFLRSVRKMPHESGCTPRVVGIDDWAWRRGQRYGTLICDLEKRRVIDLLPDREPATVEAWLHAHPEIEIVARDRNGAYGRAIARALPDAVQVADRWHLLENASAAFLSAVRQSMPAIRRTVGSGPLDPTMLTAAEKLQYDGFHRRQKTNRMVLKMVDDGVPIKRIVRLTGLSRGLVRQIMRGEREDIFRVRQSSLTPWLLRLEKEWRGGCRNGAELWRRLRGDGFLGSLRVVGEWATRQRRAEQASFAGQGKSPSARKIAKLLTTGRDHLSKADAVTVAQVEAALPALAAARELTDRFTDMVRNGTKDALDPWLSEAGNSMLASFARGLHRDRAAVVAALSQPWSNGQTEGQINRLKALKRQMYGRAKIDLLRARLVGTHSSDLPTKVHQN